MKFKWNWAVGSITAWKKLHKSYFLRLITKLDLQVRTVKASQSNGIDLINSHDKALTKEHQKALFNPCDIHLHKIPCNLKHHRTRVLQSWAFWHFSIKTQFTIKLFCVSSATKTVPKSKHTSEHCWQEKAILVSTYYTAVRTQQNWDLQVLFKNI